jgi:hypothetical protein
VGAILTIVSAGSMSPTRASIFAGISTALFLSSIGFGVAWRLAHQKRKKELVTLRSQSVTTSINFPSALLGTRNTDTSPAAGTARPGGHQP